MLLSESLDNKIHFCMSSYVIASTKSRWFDFSLCLFCGSLADLLFLDELNCLLQIKTVTKMTVDGVNKIDLC